MTGGPEDLEALRRAGSHRLGNTFLDDGDRPETPPWFDQRKFEEGREFFRRHVLSVAFSYFCSLYVGFTVDSLAKAVSFTGESDTAERSRRRYLNTMGHLFSWHTSDIISDNTSIGYRSIRFVRNMHDRVRRRMATEDTESLHRYVTQYDIAMVQTGFVGFVIMHPRRLGIWCRKDESDLDSYVYFWRVVGYILGLDDDVNACAAGLRASRRIANQIEQEIIVPGLGDPSARFIQLSEALIGGFRQFWPWLNSRVIRGYVCPIMGMPAPADMTWKDYVIVKLMKVHFFLMYLVPWYAAYWNGRVFRLMGQLLPSAVIS